MILHIMTVGYALILGDVKIAVVVYTLPAGAPGLVQGIVLQRRPIETVLFPAFSFARSVLHGPALRLGYGDVVRFLVHAKVGLHAGLLVKHFPDRGRFVAAMFLVGQSLKGPVEGTRKSDRDCCRFLVPHATEYARTRRERQDFSPDSGIPWAERRISR